MGRKPIESTPTKSKSISLYGQREFSSATRRSGRIMNQNPPSQNKEIEPIVEIDIVEDVEDDVAYMPDDVAYKPDDVEVPVPSEKRLEEKVDYIFEAVEELKSKASKPGDDVPMNDLSYKSLYFDSQEKIEALTKENYELSKKAEVALGKMEAYNEAAHVWSEMFGKIKDLLMTSNLPKKAIRKTKNLSSLTHNANPSAPKRASETLVSRNKKAKSNGQLEVVSNLPNKAIVGKANNLNEAVSAPPKEASETLVSRNKKAKSNDQRMVISNLPKKAIIRKANNLDEDLSATPKEASEANRVVETSSHVTRSKKAKIVNLNR